MKLQVQTTVDQTVHFDLDEIQEILRAKLVETYGEEWAAANVHFDLSTNDDPYSNQTWTTFAGATLSIQNKTAK